VPFAERKATMANAALAFLRARTETGGRDSAVPRKIPAMSSAMTAEQILNREFLEIRAKILEIAASFDRLDRSEGTVADDPRLRRIYEALDALRDSAGDRAEQVQLIFSRQYEQTWPEKFGLSTQR
jgi:hypothetical protein